MVVAAATTAGMVAAAGMVVAAAADAGGAICLFSVVACIFLLHLYTAEGFRLRRRPDILSAADQEVGIRGLDPSVLKTIPEVDFSSKDFKEEGLECAVCLCEVCEGEKARFLPKCDHGYHVGCIDQWFQSHSTCPLCRNPIPNPNPPSGPVPGGEVGGSPNFPTNVLFWGDETQVSTFSCPTLEERVPSPVPCSSSAAIDIPRQSLEEFGQKPTVITRLRSFKRLLMMKRREMGLIVDVEQGGLSQ
ncbi:unnamed protein product [Cuscuta campestris]|uniref:RING-type domain-containing protein n=1 Tax=Cuscuta campestris TaxID=132261 RepID=A0A484M4F9_9ASTE|nr:unnamed protein product [Cuscuta campestris]